MVSVIVPVYNVEKYLRECLDGIRSQTYARIEVILIDDGSTDSSVAICDEYAAKDSRFKVLHTENSGQAAARNLGLTYASGEWIVFIDSDDVVPPYAIETLLESVNDKDAEIAVAGFSEFADSIGFKFSPKSGRNKTLGGKEAALKMLYQNSDSKGFICSPWSKIFHRDLINKFNFTEGILYEDLELLPRIVAAARQIVAIDSICYGYRNNPESSLGQFSQRRFDALKACRLLQQYFLGDAELSRAANDRLLSAAFNMLMTMGRHGYHDSARINECCEIIRRYRRASLWNRRVRFRNKAGILLSYIIGPKRFASTFFARFLRR